MDLLIAAFAVVVFHLFNSASGLCTKYVLQQNIVNSYMELGRKFLIASDVKIEK